MNDPRISFLNSLTAGTGTPAYELITGTSIRIVVSAEAITTFSGQILVYQLATLTARLFDRIELFGDATAQCHPDLSLLSGPFLTSLRELLPRLRPLTPAPVSIKSITVVVGRGSDTTGDIFVGATAWGVRLSKTGPQSVADTKNPIGALAAGTLGASEIFKVVFQNQLPGAVTAPGYTLSLVDYQEAVDQEPTFPDHITIDANLFGCGSIGCAFLQAVLLTPQLQGKLVVVDNGRFDTKNPYKYPLLDWEAAQQEGYKAVWAQQQLQSHARGRLEAYAFVGTADTYVASLPHDYALPLAISAVDTSEARFQIQDTLPRFTLNAGIDGTLAEVSVHGFGNGPCLACLQMLTELESWNAKPIAEQTGLPPQRVHQLIQGNEAMTAEDLAQIRASKKISAEFLGVLDSFLGQPLLSFWNRVAYSEATVLSPGAKPIRVTTAFVSAFAGILLLAELVKKSVPDLQRYLVNNSYQQQLLGIPAGGVFRHERDPHHWCLCHSTYRLAIYREKYGTD